MKLSVTKKIFWLAFALIFIATWVSPMWPFEQAMHDSLMVFGVALLFWYDRKHPLSDFNFALVMVFIIIHTLGAYWLYSKVPYDQWAQRLWDQSLSQMFGWQRNHFDRLVHFMYGLCLTPALMQIVKNMGVKRSVYAWGIANAFIMITGLWYEWLEWLIAIGLSPEDAEAYNGQQGDMWDAHKDLALATFGALLWGFGLKFLWYKNKGHTS